MSESRISELEARLQQLEVESRAREERLTFLEGSFKSKRSRGLRVRVILLGVLISAFLLIRFREQLGF